MSDLDGPHKLLPNYLPVEMKNLIHLYAGTCTSSCKYIKTHILYIKNTEFYNRLIYNEFNKERQTLWACNIVWNTPKYTKKWVKNLVLSTQELDLKVAWYVLQRDQYFSLNRIEHDLTIEWFETRIDEIHQVLRNRLYDTLYG